MPFSCAYALLVFAILVCTESASYGANTPGICRSHGNGSCGKAVVLLSINTTVRKSPEKLQADTAAMGSSEGLKPVNHLSLLGSAHDASKTILEYDSNNDDGETHTSVDLQPVVHLEEFGQVSRKYTTTRYMPGIWNSPDEIKLSHNCYMYALNDFSPRSQRSCMQTRSSYANFIAKEVSAENKTMHERELQKACRRYFHKPGYYFQHFAQGRATTDTWAKQDTSCKFILPMIAADSPSIVWHNDQDNGELAEDSECPQGHYMAALFVDPRKGFHFYRRDRTCAEKGKSKCWSHKPGILEATDVDASGKQIVSVLEADRNYGMLNYSELCSFFCVPENSVADTHSDSRRISSSSTSNSD